MLWSLAFEVFWRWFPAFLGNRTAIPWHRGCDGINGLLSGVGTTVGFLTFLTSENDQATKRAAIFRGIMRSSSLVLCANWDKLGVKNTEKTYSIVTTRSLVSDGNFLIASPGHTAALSQWCGRCRWSKFRDWYCRGLDAGFAYRIHCLELSSFWALRKVWKSWEVIYPWSRPFWRPTHMQWSCMVKGLNTEIDWSLSLLLLFLPYVTQISWPARRVCRIPRNWILWTIGPVNMIERFADKLRDEHPAFERSGFQECDPWLREQWPQTLLSSCVGALWYDNVQKQ